MGEAQKVWLCGCKRSKKKPFCDGSHRSLPA
jgi:CDGSH-type Zn-finger protein